MSTTPAPRRSRAIVLSNILFALVAVAAIVIGYLYFFDNRFFHDGPVAPTPEAGRNEFISVINALKDQGLEDVDPGRYSATADQLTVPGQVVEIGDLNAFVFVYNGATPEEAIAAREADAEDLNGDTVHISARISERSLNADQPVHIFQHSNIVVILVGGDDATVQHVQDAIDSLP